MANQDERPTHTPGTRKGEGNEQGRGKGTRTSGLRQHGGWSAGGHSDRPGFQHGCTLRSDRPEESQDAASLTGAAPVTLNE